jgi:chromosome segregation ATPase
MSDTLWNKALKKSKLLQNHLKSEQLSQELEKVTGDSKIRKLNQDSENNRGFLSIWLSMASLRERISEIEKGLNQFEEDINHLFQEKKSIKEEVDELSGTLYEEQKQTAKYIRNLTEKKYKAYQKLLEARNSDTTQKEIADELDIDEAVLSRFKKDFKENNIL